jgi:hypothetical protein
MIPVNRVLEKLSDLPRESGGRQTFAFTDAANGVAVRLELENAEALALQVWEVEVTPSQPPAAPLAERAKALAAKATGLLEPLRLIEVDAGAAKALLRSAQPAATDAERYYYEAVMEGGGRTTLRRYQGSTAVSGRRSISYTLTREALAKLVSDLAG